jgi:hypothetical protein
VFEDVFDAGGFANAAWSMYQQIFRFTPLRKRPYCFGYTLDFCVTADRFLRLVTVCQVGL